MTATSDSSSRLLPALAWLQAFAIVALMVVWLRTGDGAAATPPFEPAAESGASAAPAAAAAQHGGS
ncbi:MAG: hypothetical protein KDE27_24130, partial [Planctomycetes bacterium]|nr:hypothetical protein [Planctomycetota bacterium]